MDATRRESDAASRTTSLRRNWPGKAEIAGNPPAVASATPGVLRKKVSGGENGDVIVLVDAIAADTKPSD